MTATSSVGATIRERRLAAGLTLVELAERSGLSQPFLSQVENGRAHPSMESLYRIASALGNRSIAFLGNHGIVVVGADVHDTYNKMYYLERACRNLALAYQTGQRLNVMPPAVAEKTAQEWEDYGEMAFAHFFEQKALLDSVDGSYAE